MADADELRVQELSPNVVRPPKKQLNNNASLFMTDSRIEEGKYGGPYETQKTQE